MGLQIEQVLGFQKDDNIRFDNFEILEIDPILGRKVEDWRGGLAYEHHRELEDSPKG